MKYILLAYTNVDAWADATPEEIQATGPDVYAEIGRELVERGEAVYNAGLGEPPHTRTLRKRGDQVVTTDGPYAEVKEVLVGFWIIDVRQPRPGDGDRRAGRRRHRRRDRGPPADGRRQRRSDD